jgi:6-pyruvoyltetrahydropterin/6-carboxytetrahydropterin synthase
VPPGPTGAVAGLYLRLMFRLTREVRFAINASPDEQLAGKPTNAYAGFPSLTGLGQFFAIRVALAGEPAAASQYVRNIKDIDDAVRRTAVPHVSRHVRERTFGGGGRVVAGLFGLLRDAWPGAELVSLGLSLSPFLAWSAHAVDQPSTASTPEPTMVRLSQKFEFSATHRLHNPTLSDEDNRATFGKCNNPHGHGHNYEVQVTLVGEPDDNGVLVDVPAFERTVAEAAIDRLDHKHLNVEVPEFRRTIPSVENIAKVVYRLLEPRFADGPAKLASVTVWETPKTWCEYSE